MRPFLTALVFAGVFGCNGDADGVDGIDPQRTSELCDEVRGMEALAWDYYNGVIVLDPSLPPPIPVGGTYSHTDFPLLGFSYPADWTPTELRDVGVMGVNLIRDDDRAIYRYATVFMQGAPTVEQVVDLEVQAVRDYMALTGEGGVVCRNRVTAETSPGTNIIADVNNVLVRIEDQSLILNASVTTVPGVPQRSIMVRLVSARTAEFPERLYDTFIAIDWQMLLGGGGDERDRDGDGYWDNLDNFPDDPTRH